MTCAGGLPFGENRATPLFGDREAVPMIAAALSGAEAQSARGSLFAGQARGGLLAPYPARLNLAPGNLAPGRAPHAAQPGAAAAPGGAAARGVRGLMALIAEAEAGPAGYDAVVWSARVKPPKAPTAMTLAEIERWIDDTPGQNHAIGRYQFIPKTLRWLVARAGIAPHQRFSPQLQDRLAYMLLQDAGLDAFLRGALGRTAFMNRLAKTWAGLPTSSGKSHYHGFAGNKATMTWARFDAQMQRIFPRG
jgi:muramidase (phage lysozyme)